MKRKITLALFVVISIIQLIAVGANIIRYEKILANGRLWKFEVKPIDPYDVLRGRYVQLRFKGTKLQPSQLEKKNRRIHLYKKAGYVILENKGGFAKPLHVVTENPTSKADDWIPCKISNYRYQSEKSRNINITYPFDRFYMNEELAPEAESLLRSNNDVMKNSKVYVSVKIKDGIGVIENLWIDELPINEYLRKQKQAVEDDLK